MAAEGKVAVVTGTSRDVGEYVCYGFAQAGWDILGLYRNPQHNEDQASIIKRVKDYKVKMRAIRADLLDPNTPDLLLQELQENFGGRINALVLSASVGLGISVEEARKVNVEANLRLVDKLSGNLVEGGIVVYATSEPAHEYHLLENPEEQLGDYYSVARTKNEAEQILRARRDLRTGFVIGNGLEGTFVTRVLKRRAKDIVGQWQEKAESGQFPLAMEMASAIVNVARGNCPSGHTEYVGVDLQYQLYPARPEGLKLIGAPEMMEGSVLSRAELEEIIPHRWPFSFIGGVSNIEFGKKASGWLVDLTHPDINWRVGHFPEYPVVPGVITQEALQQLGALVALGVPEYRGRIAVLTGADMRFRRQIAPGEMIRLEAEGLNLRERLGSVFGKGQVAAFNEANKEAVSGTISFSLITPISSLMG